MNGNGRLPFKVCHSVASEKGYDEANSPPVRFPIGARSTIVCIEVEREYSLRRLPLTFLLNVSERSKLKPLGKRFRVSRLGDDVINEPSRRQKCRHHISPQVYGMTGVA